MPVVRGSLGIAVDSYLDRFKFKNKLRAGLNEYTEDIETDIGEILEDIYRHIGVFDQLPDAIKPNKGIILGKKRQGGLAFLTSQASRTGGSMTDAALGGFNEKIRQAGLAASGSTLIPLNVALEIFKWGGEWADLAFNALHFMGYGDDAIKALTASSFINLSGTQIISLMLRGDIIESDARNRLKRIGYSEESVERLMTLSQQIPPIQDLVRMAVREAFSPEAIDRFSLGANFPKEIIPHAKAQGLSEDWVKRYWYAHWQLPSIQQGFEMYQRLRPGATDTTFTKADLEELMITADIPQFFRERLIQIAYTPFTRVDIRRFYKTGVMNEQEVYEAYLDIGYSPENARKQQEFVKLDSIDTEDELTKGMLINAYKKGLITEQQVTLMLHAIGIPQEITTFLVRVAKFEKELAERDEEIEFLTTEFLEGILSEVQLRDRLNQLNLPGHETETIVLKARRKKISQRALPSRGDIDEWFAKRIITDADYRTLMLQKGFIDADIDRFRKSLNIDIAANSAKEMEQKSKETARLQKERAASTFEKQLAALDVQIAEKKLAIANIKLALDDVTSDEVAANMKDRILIFTRDIAAIQLQKAQVTLASEG